jgi:hypothetical protein
MPEAALPSVSVVIPTMGQRPVLQRALASVLADEATTEVLIVLDEPGGETEAGERLMERFEAIDPRIRTMRRPTGGADLLTLQIARDAGAERARSELVLAIDDDVTLEPGTVSGHARAHATGERQVVLGYMPVVSSRHWPLSNATIRNYSASYEYHCELYESEPETILRQLWAGNMSLRREDWLRAIERPRLKCWGHDDQELGLLFLREGLQGRFDRGLRAGHWYERSFPAFVKRAEGSPAGQAMLRAANRDLLEEPQHPARSKRDLVSGPFLRLSRRSAGWWLVRSALIAAICLAGAVRLHRVEDAATRYLWFLASQRAQLAGTAPT